MKICVMIGSVSFRNYTRMMEVEMNVAAMSTMDPDDYHTTGSEKEG